MYVNIPKYGRANRTHSSSIVNHGRQGQGQKENDKIVAA